MRILVTGGAGFIGANFVRFLAGAHPEDEIVALDSLTYAGHRASLAGLEDRVTFVEADICDEDAVMGVLPGIDRVVHFAAESHVDRSIGDPATFLRTNVIGTEILLRGALACGVDRFHHVSTDEVFGELTLDAVPFDERSPYAPRSPYAASKASSDHIVRAYAATYDLPVTITNCSNNYGPYQLPEKIVPLFVTNALADQPLPLYGDGTNVRDYLFVEDHCRAVDVVLRHGRVGETYCVGGGAERSGIEVAEAVLAALGKPRELMTFVGDRPGHDRRYAVDATRLTAELGWTPLLGFEEGIRRTVDWYRDNPWWWEPIKRAIEPVTWGAAS